MAKMQLKVIPEFWQKMFKAVEDNIELPEGVNKETIQYRHELTPGDPYPSLTTTISMDIYGNKVKLRAKLEMTSLEIIQ